MKRTLILSLATVLITVTLHSAEDQPRPKTVLPGLAKSRSEQTLPLLPTFSESHSRYLKYAQAKAPRYDNIKSKVPSRIVKTTSRTSIFELIKQERASQGHTSKDHKIAAQAEISLEKIERQFSCKRIPAETARTLAQYSLDLMINKQALPSFDPMEKTTSCAKMVAANLQSLSKLLTDEEGQRKSMLERAYKRIYPHTDKLVKRGETPLPKPGVKIAVAQTPRWK